MWALGRSFFRMLLAAVIVFPLVFAAAMDKGISHDEHQHIAAGALLAREGLLPYRDFPYLHTPNLVFVFAGMFQLSDKLIMVARIFCEICTALTAGAIFAVAWRAFRDWPWRARLAGASGSVALLITTPSFFEATGFAWNQQPSVLFAVLSALLVVAARNAPRPSLLIFGSGLCLGISVGFRLTFAPIALPLLCILFFAPDYGVRNRWPFLAWFSAGAALALAPLWWLFIIAPEQTYFANFQFPSVNITYRFATGEPRTMTLATKLRFMVKEVGYVNWILLLGLATALGWYLRYSARKAERFPLAVLGVLLPFVLAGALAPSPLYQQYFYAAVPFLILGMIFAAAPLFQPGNFARPALIVLALTVLLSIGMVAKEYEQDVGDLGTPATWKAMKSHSEAQWLRPLVGAGPVLTLAPTDALEAGLKIYPAFSTGPFTWRVAPFIDLAKRDGLRIIGPDTLDSLLNSQPPAAVLLGYEGKLEKPLEAAAKARGLIKESVGKRRLWHSGPRIVTDRAK